MNNDPISKSPMNKDPMQRARDIDQWLESALSHYGKAEPRTGLEGRVLANLRAERNRFASRRRWWWAIGAATALATIVLAVWVGESGHERNPGSTVGISTAHREEALQSMRPGPAPQVAAPQVANPTKEVAKRRPADRPLRDLAVASAPKLAQFPSPQPLSQQEKILMSYVAQYPESAALVAHARAEALQRDREEEAAEAATNSMR